MSEKENLTEAFNAIFTRGINIANKESMNLVFKQLNEYHKCIAADKRYKIKYVNGVHLSFVYSSARKANTDRNYIIKWLKDYVN